MFIPTTTTNFERKRAKNTLDKLCDGYKRQYQPFGGLKIDARL